MSYTFLGSNCKRYKADLISSSPEALDGGDVAHEAGHEGGGGGEGGDQHADQRVPQGGAHQALQLGALGARAAIEKELPLLLRPEPGEAFIVSVSLF